MTPKVFNFTPKMYPSWPTLNIMSMAMRRRPTSWKKCALGSIRKENTSLGRIFGMGINLLPSCEGLWKVLKVERQFSCQNIGKIYRFADDRNLSRIVRRKQEKGKKERKKLPKIPDYYFSGIPSWVIICFFNVDMSRLKPNVSANWSVVVNSTDRPFFRDSIKPRSRRNFTWS